MKKIITLVVTTILIIGLGGLYFFQTRINSVDIYEGEPPPTPLITLIDRAATDITHLYTSWEAETILFIQNENNRWVMADEPTFLLHDLRMIEMAQLVAGLTVRDIAHQQVQDLSLADFGLDPALFTLTAYFNDNTQHQIYIGNRTPDGLFHFMMVDETPTMYLLPTSVALRLKQQPTDLIDRRLPFLQSENIQRFHVVQEGREIIDFVQKTDEEANPNMVAAGIIQMMVHEPLPMAGRTVESFQIRRGVMEPFAEAFQLLDVVALNPADLSPYGLDAPFLDFLFESEDAFLHLLFGNTFTREVNGVNQAFIYVKFADRPHIFTAPFAPIMAITDLNAMQFISRFIVMVPILEVEAISVTHHQDYARNVYMVVNHFQEGDNNRINPTINGITVAEADFRLMYRLLIALGTDAHVDPFHPDGEPIFTVVYHLLDGTEKSIDYFAFDAHFYAFSLDGDYVWAVTNQRNVDVFFAEVLSAIS